eukprot:GAHX01001197.1.p1 GENE.GAHX01001197.1~~GAHX01001197.1.p1  ORF type:complete len:402 (+),score=87.75 GAHX01001197.1:40-1245(+)
MTSAKDDLKDFMNTKLTKLVTYNPSSLVEYLLMVAPKCDEETQLDVYLQTRLEEFLGDNTGIFIKDLVRHLNTQNISIRTLSYKSQPVVKSNESSKPSTPSQTQQQTTTKKLKTPYNKPAVVNQYAPRQTYPNSQSKPNNSGYNQHHTNQYRPTPENRYNERQTNYDHNNNYNYSNYNKYNNFDNNRRETPFNHSQQQRQPSHNNPNYYNKESNVHKFSDRPVQNSSRISSTVIFTRLPLFLNNKMKLYSLLKGIGSIVKIENNFNKSLALIRFKDTKEAEVVFNEGLEKVPILKASNVNINYASNLICKETPMYISIEKEAKLKELGLKEKECLVKVAVIFEKIGKYREILKKAEQNKESEQGKEIIRKITSNVLKLKNDMDESKIDLEVLRKEKEKLEN